MKKFLLLFILLCFVLFISGCGKQPAGKTAANISSDTSASAEERKKNAEKDNVKVFDVQTEQVIPGKLNDYVQVVGATFPDIKMNLSSFSGGLVEKLYFDAGSFIHKGDTIAEIDLQLLIIQLNKFMAQFEDVKNRYEKDKKLLESNAIAKNKFIETKSKYETMLQEIEQIKVYIDRAIIKAPFDGYITQKFVEMGEIIPQGKAICSLTKMDRLRVKFELPSKDIGFFSEGMTSVLITFDAYPKDRKISKINTISREINTLNLTYEAEAFIENQDYKYKAGLLTRVQVMKQSNSNTVVLPKDAVLDYEDGHKVFVLNVDGKTVSLRKIQIGATEGDKIQVTKGLEFGENVIVSGQKELYEGAKVRIFDSRANN